MDTNNWRPMECGDWRSQLQSASRERIVNALTNILKRHVMLSGHEVQCIIKKTAVEIEELIYSTATSQVDYLQNISLKMKKFEIKSQNPIPVANNVNPSHPGWQVPQQVNSQLGQRGQQLLPHIMHNNNVGNSTIESGDWRNQLRAGSRQWTVNWIVKILKRHLPFSGYEMLQELEKIAQRFEERLFTAATSQSDYIQKIGCKLMSMEKISQNPVPDTMQSNSGADDDMNQSSSQVMQLLSQSLHNIGSTGMQENGDSSLQSSDWRDQLQADSRQWIVNKIMDTLKRHLLIFEPEMLQEVEKAAVSFEEKIYTAATSQSDYMRKIFLKVPTIETISQYPVPYTMQSNSGANSMNPPYPGSQVPQQLNKQGQPNPIHVHSNHPQPRQQPLSQAMHHNIGSTGIQAIGDSSTESGDWRSKLQEDLRQRIVNRIMNTLKRQVPECGDEGLQVLMKISARVEEKVYTAATSQPDYLRKISLKLLSISSQKRMPDAMQSNSGANSVNPSDPGCHVTQQANSQRQPHPLHVLSNHPHLRQQPSSGMQAIGDSSTESGDWRSQLQADLRQRIVNRMINSLKRHFLVCGDEGIQDVEKIAVTFEEKFYTAATSKIDYLRRISLKLMGIISQDPIPGAMQSNSGPNSVDPSDPGSKVIHQVNSQGQPHPHPNLLPSYHPQPGQQLLSQNMHKNISSSGSQGSSRV